MNRPRGDCWPGSKKKCQQQCTKHKRQYRSSSPKDWRHRDSQEWTSSSSPSHGKWASEQLAGISPDSGLVPNWHRLKQSGVARSSCLPGHQIQTHGCEASGFTATASEKESQTVCADEMPSSVDIQQKTRPYTPQEINFLRLISMYTNVSRKVLWDVFRKGTSQRPHQMPLFVFYEGRGVHLKKFQKNLNSDQIKKIENDPEGATFDVSLLYICIYYGCDGVEHANNDVWWNGSASLESKLTAIKNSRNKIFHERPAFDHIQFIKRTEDLRQLLTETITLTGERYDSTSATISQELEEMNSSLNSFRDEPFVVQNIEDYKKQVLFEEHSHLVNTKGREDMCMQYKRKCETMIMPVNHMEEIQFPVNTVFTRMKVKSESVTRIKEEVRFEDIPHDDGENLELEEILKDDSSNTNLVILFEGIAGVGKTTLSKKILDDWMSSEQSNIISLDTYDLLLRADCRDTSIASFNDLLRHLMPNVSKCFREDDLKQVTLSQKIMVLLDGLDEINASSARLFQEVIDLRKRYEITLLITTRPEKLEYFYRIAASSGIRTKHIELLGIPHEKQEEFVTKYYNALKSKSVPISDIKNLLGYLKRTRYRLGGIWRLPYNLALLIILWIHNSSLVFAIDTSPELYWQILLLYKSKLEGRLLRYERTPSINGATLKDKIDSFLQSLSLEALCGLMSDNITLTQESYRRLEVHCSCNNLPSEEMMGAFLKCVVTKLLLGFSTRYSFPHKFLQDFLGALCIFAKIQTEVSKHNDDDAPSSTFTILKDILTKIDCFALTNIEKYQNVFVTLIGIIYLREIRVPDHIKLELLHLLKDTGIKNRNSWLRILNSVKCDDFISTFISQQPHILEGIIKVDDSNIFAYISLLKTLQKPFQNKADITLLIQLSGDTHGLQELLVHTARLELEVKNLLLHEDFQKTVSSVPYRGAIKDLLHRYEVVTYAGIWSADFSLPVTMWRLYANIEDAASFLSLREDILALPALEFLQVCVQCDIATEVLTPLPGNLFVTAVYLPDLKDSDVSCAGIIIKRLQPTDGTKTFSNLFFPRASLSYQGMKDLIQALEGVAVGETIVFPSTCKPSFPEEERTLVSLAETILQDQPCIEWGGITITGSIDDW